MVLPGLITLDPTDAELAAHLAEIGGDSFVEENWMRTLLSAFPSTSTGGERERFIAHALIAADIAVGAPHGFVYCLEDGSALAIAVRTTELPHSSWSQLESSAILDVAESVLTPEETQALTLQLEKMVPVSQFDWHSKGIGEDRLYFPFLAVDPAHRQSGRFSKLFEPFLAYADAEQIPCVLETYSPELVKLYEHYGFEEVQAIEDETLGLVQHCMVRKPQA